MKQFIVFVVFINKAASLSKQLTTKSQTIWSIIVTEVNDSDKVPTFLFTSRMKLARPESNKNTLPEDTRDITDQVDVNDIH